MSPSKQYDLAVIGSGPAGEMAAIQGSFFGKRVILIEEESDLGGAAVNTGTLPSKTLRETALFLAGFQQRAFFGLDLAMAPERITAREFLFQSTCFHYPTLSELYKHAAYRAFGRPVIE